MHGIIAAVCPEYAVPARLSAGRGLYGEQVSDGPSASNAVDRVRIPDLPGTR